MKLLLLSFILSSCASIHQGEVAKTTNKYVVGSGRIMHDMSDEYHTFVNFTFENMTNKWMRVKKVEFSCDEKCMKNTKILLGKDLITWSEAASSKKALEDYNRSMLLGGLAIAGAAVAASSNSSGGQTAGLAAYGVGVGGLATQDINKSLNKIEVAKVVPESHLLAPFSIPAGLFIRKWIVLYSPKESAYPRDVKIKLTFEDGKSFDYLIQTYRPDIRSLYEEEEENY